MNPFLLFGLLGIAFRGFGSSGGTTGPSSSLETAITNPGDSQSPKGKPNQNSEPEQPILEEPENEPTPPVQNEQPEEEQPPAQQPEPPQSEEPTQGENEQPSQGEGETEEPTQGETEPPSQGETEEPTPQQPQPEGPAPEGPDQTGGTGEDGGDTAPLAAQGSVSVYGGRVATLEPVGSDIASVQITSGVAHGTLTVNPDNTMALVMTRSDFTGNQSFQYEVTDSTGATSTHNVTLNVQPGLQGMGWGTGESQYMLATDADGQVIVEHGENHVKVHVSGSSDALTRAEIAAMEGVSESTVTGSWIANNTTYGQTADTALAEDIGHDVWRAVTPRSQENSNHLLFERGYEYDLGDTFSLRGTHGESELHPVYIGAYGEGAQPVIDTRIVGIAESARNVVIQNIEVAEGTLFIDAENVLFDNVNFTDAENVVHHTEGMTFRNSSFVDIYLEESQNGGDWENHSDRSQGLFVDNTEGLLLDGLFLDHSGWADGYDYDGDASGGQPPSMFSHNLYLTDTNDDLTLRDSIIMRAASIGAQVRSGAYFEDNAFIDNNIGANFTGGFNGNGEGLYTLFADNVITSGGFREANFTGAIGWGVDSRGELSTLIDNIIAHAADPNNPEEQAEREAAFRSYQPDENHYYDDTIVYNWTGSGNDYTFNIPEANAEGLDEGVLNQTTIQNFAAGVLGDPNASIEDLANFLTAQAADGMHNDTITADDIIRYFQQGFGIEADVRTDATTATFVPSDLADGVRWDNRLNWDTDEVPGSVAGDSVDLAGNEVVYNANTTIDTLDLSGGTLDAYGGRLTATGGVEDDGTIEIQEAGQIWVGGSDGSDLDIDLGGGRFVNTGDLSGAELTATSGQAILASDGAEFDLNAGDTLSVSSTAEVGFDGDGGGQAILDLHDSSTVAFMSGGDGGLGEIAEFRSGAFGDAPNVQSGIDLGSATLDIDLSGVSGSSFTLMSADEIAGLIDSASVGGLGSRDATITIDYGTDTVTLQLASGSGNVSIETVGDESDVSAGYQSLWDTLTSGQGVASETSAAQTEEEDLDDLAA